MSKQPEQEVTIQDNFIEWEQCRYGIRHIRLAQDNAGQVLVFLHDALGSIAQWKDFPNRLAEACGLNAVLIERQGHGSSSPLQAERDITYLHREAHEVLPAILELLQIDQPVLIGHSDGGTIALLYGSRLRPGAIISIAAHIFVEPITIHSIQKNVQQADRLRAKLAKYHHDLTDALFRAWHKTWLSEEFRDFNIEQEIRQIAAPTLIIQSKDDEYGSLRQVDRIFSLIRSEIKAVILPETGGHMLHLARPDLLIAEISTFLAGLKD